MRPQNLDAIIGQPKAKQLCKIIIEAARKESRQLPHISLFSPSGCGKTTFSRAIALESGKRFLQANGATIQSKEDLIRYLGYVGEFGILFIDEIHRMDKAAIELLYTAMEDFQYDYVDKDGSPVNQKMSPFTVIGATNFPGDLPEALKNRFKVAVQLEDYTNEDMEKVVRVTADKLGLTLSHESVKSIAKTSRLTPRVAISRTEYIRDCKLAGLPIDSQRDIEYTFNLIGIDSNGFTDADRKYLNFLPASLNSLCSALRLDKKTVVEDVEPYLFRCGLIKVTSKGRELCQKSQTIESLLKIF